MSGSKRVLLGVVCLLWSVPGAGQELHGFVEALNGVRLVDGSGFERGSYTAREARLMKRFGTWIKSVKSSRLRAMEVLLDDWLRSAQD